MKEIAEKSDGDPSATLWCRSGGIGRRTGLKIQIKEAHVTSIGIVEIDIISFMVRP
jgi:hypothetical protein